MFTLINPQTGDLAFRICRLESGDSLNQLQRLNHYSLIWAIKGTGKARADFSEYFFSNNTLFAFAPYQPFMIDSPDLTEAVVLNFHSDFFCIHKHQQEVACNGLLFNNIYEPPFITVDGTAAETFGMLLEQMKKEMQNPALAQYELLVSYLKIFLITASRLMEQVQGKRSGEHVSDTEPFILQDLKNYIETHYRTKHAPGEYAELLHISPKALAKITRTHFNKTLTDLISERIIIEAKRELYLTKKAVKEIAYELGYADEYYFSRFFKNNTEVSPQTFRETVGFGKGSAGN